MTDTPEIACEACAAIDAGGSALCNDHERAQVGPDAPADVADLIRAAARHKRIALVILEGAPPEPPAPAPVPASINVSAVELDGKRVVQLVIPAGGEAVAVVLTPDVAEALARTLAQQARIARSPAGLILPGS